MTRARRSGDPHVRALVACLSVLFLATMTAGCAGTDPDTADPAGYVEPAWMAEERRVQEETQNKLMACFTEAGVVNVTPLPGGGFAGYDPPGMTEAEQQLKREKMIACRDEIVGDEPLTVEHARLSYDRALDTKACIESFGITVSSPPTKETYVDTFMSYGPPGSTFPWVPMDSAIDWALANRWTAEQYNEVAYACVQFGPGVTFSM